MTKKILTMFMIILFTGCASVKDKMQKRKACTGEVNTLADLICKK